jgi:hypothetical protein
MSTARSMERHPRNASASTPATASLDCHTWQRHCRARFQIPISALLGIGHRHVQVNWENRAWRLEARGEIRGGRFVAGVTGEQFAAPEAIGLLRDVRRRERSGAVISLSGADPLNLVGILTRARVCRH